LLTRPGGDWIGLAPPLCTTRDEADEIVAILEAAVGEVEQSSSRVVEE
jgi:adenosylmethionine-8-amino-7-oxononanoate aminotransferase